MKNFLGFITGFFTALLLLVLVVPSMAEGLRTTINVSFSPIKTIINGNEYTPLEDMKPFMYNDRTYVSLRFIAEALGKEISWDGTTRSVTIDDPKPLTADEKVFEDSFINKPLSDKWSKIGTWTFDGINGLKSSKNTSNLLCLGEINEKSTSKNYTIEFEALGTNESIACFSIGTEKTSEALNSNYLTDTFCITTKGIYFIAKGNTVMYSNLRSDFYLAADKAMKSSTYYKVKLNIDNTRQIITLYIDGDIVLTQNFSSQWVDPYYSFRGASDSECYYRNFKLTYLA